MQGDRIEAQGERQLHVGSLIPDYAAGRLESAHARALEAHLLVCDPCFAALLAHHLWHTAQPAPA